MRMLSHFQTTKCHKQIQGCRLKTDMKRENADFKDLNINKEKAMFHS